MPRWVPIFVWSIEGEAFCCCEPIEKKSQQYAQNNRLYTPLEECVYRQPTHQTKPFFQTRTKRTCIVRSQFLQWRGEQSQPERYSTRTVTSSEVCPEVIQIEDTHTTTFRWKTPTETLGRYPQKATTIHRSRRLPTPSKSTRCRRQVPQPWPTRPK